MKRFSVSLADTMMPVEQLMDSMLAPNDGELYKSIENKIYSSPNVFSRIPIWQELVTKKSLAKL